MKKIALLYCLGLVGPLLASEASPKELTAYVDTRIGSVDGNGKTVPGASAPFAMTNWVPATGNGQRPYDYNAKKIEGFRASHFPSGSCMADYAAVSIMPVNRSDRLNREERASTFSHKRETALPHYYSVVLEDAGITAELTSTLRCGFLRLTFPKDRDACVIVEPFEGEGKVEIDRKRGEVSGYSDYRFRGYFSFQFDRPFSAGFVRGGRALVRFPKGTTRVMVKGGTSFISLQQARANLRQEIPHWSFERTVNELKRAWADVLSRFSLVASEDQKTVFYTAVYHQYLLPRTFYEIVGGQRTYLSPFDGKVHKGSYYEDYSLWDTYRATHPLFVLLEPVKTAEFVEGLVRIYEEGGWMPKWPNPKYTNVMIGTHADSVVADAVAKGIRNIPLKKAYEAMLKNANVPGSNTPAGFYEGREGISWYKELGYVPVDKAGEAVSNTLEGAYNDYCVAQVAKALGKESDYSHYLRRSLNYRNVFDPRIGFMRGRYSDGSWTTESNPSEGYGWFTEANSWIYTWYVPHDVQGLINLIGGREAFVKKLQQFFDGNHFDPGNEPGMQVPFLFDYAGAPWLTQKYIRQLMGQRFKPTPDGIPGDDDCGQMSAWYIFSAMGFYPVCPGQTAYAIGSPMFPRIRARLGNGRWLDICAYGVSQENVYIQRAELNGKPLRRPWLDHKEIAGGGVLKFWMGPVPNKKWGSAPGLAPPSISGSRPSIRCTAIEAPDDPVKAGDPFAVALLAANQGNGVGARSFDLKDGASLIGTYSVVLAPNEEKRVRQAVTAYKPGRRTFTADGRSAEVGIVPSPARLSHVTIRGTVAAPPTYGFVVTVRNSGGTAAEMPVDMVVDGKTVARRSVRLEPGEQADVAFRHQFESSGVHEIKSGDLPALLIGIPDVSETVPAEGLVLWLRPEQQQGDKLPDFSGMAHQAIVLNAGNGGSGKSLRFDPSLRTCVKVSDSPFLNPSDAISVEAWFCPTDWRSNRRVLQKGFSDDQYRLTVEDDFKFHIAGVGAVSTRPPECNKWHHAVGTYDSESGVMRLWLDGKKVAEVSARGSIPVPDPTGPLYVGTKHAAAPEGDFFNGIIGDVRLYNRALTPDEVRRLHSSRSAGKDLPFVR